jgi:SAM-dependent methyltransferase
MIKKDKNEWVPTPSFLYRNYLYRRLSSILKKDAYFLEVGGGHGDFLKYLINLGYKGESIDTSNEVVSLLSSQNDGVKGVSVKKGNILTYKSKGKYDAVFCFEVLEHIKEDNSAIKNISSLLKPGGFFFFSVPAHQREWSVLDKTKGHYRRYEKKGIVDMLRTNNFEPVKILNYGFPFLTIIRMLTKTGRLVKLQKMNLKKITRTGFSGINQEYNPKLKFLISNPILLFPLFKIMDLFLGFDLGPGYIVLAKRNR